MSESFAEALKFRTQDVPDNCTRCGRSFEVCTEAVNPRFMLALEEVRSVIEKELLGEQPLPLRGVRIDRDAASAPG